MALVMMAAIAMRFNGGFGSPTHVMFSISLGRVTYPRILMVLSSTGLFKAMKKIL
jgi:hypothetical protein